MTLSRVASSDRCEYEPSDWPSFQTRLHGTMSDDTVRIVNACNEFVKIVDSIRLRWTIDQQTFMDTLSARSSEFLNHPRLKARDSRVD
jgi:hypothetical protein